MVLTIIKKYLKMNIGNKNNKFAEEDLENAIIDLILEHKNYLFIHGESIHRKYDEVLLKDDLKNFLLKMNGKNLMI